MSMVNQLLWLDHILRKFMTEVMKLEGKIIKIYKKLRKIHKNIKTYIYYIF